MSISSKNIITYYKDLPAEFQSGKNLHSDYAYKEYDGSVLCIDIKAMTVLADAFTVDTLLELASIHHSKIFEVVHNYDGFIGRTNGAFNQSFFIQDKNQSAAKRACLAAKEIVTYFLENPIYEGLDITLKAGINTGSFYLMSVGDEKSRQIITSGIDVNYAEDLMEKTRYYDTTIMLSETTKNGLDLETRQIDSIYRKGVEGAHSIFQLL
ncbi:adenylate/guanylate cyclase domain-containing protein [Turneriella parva]|uniref:Uncharacterized protein n=1 Tax=Turneriella parva (strain ATCC BAA-1111 / DSM 21527 / NCTC 11395 / H) TaxID=869212 RepID=I4B9M9_TURPD|nr:hypothetical protein [Turneriella parva]AFM13986.1 hypothetical protein Turpa_3348 [Turneriella parva DSM 21527]